jgi:phytol kinase
MKKSVAGLLSVFFGGWVMSMLVLAVYSGVGVFPTSFTAYLIPVTIIAFCATLVESLPFQDIDNITMTLTAAILGYFLF